MGRSCRRPLRVAGFAIIEAAILVEGIGIVSGTPCAVAQCVVEVWPLQDPPEEICWGLGVVVSAGQSAAVTTDPEVTRGVRRSAEKQVYSAVDRQDLLAVPGLVGVVGLRYLDHDVALLQASRLGTDAAG